MHRDLPEPLYRLKPWRSIAARYEERAPKDRAAIVAGALAIWLAR